MAGVEQLRAARSRLWEARGAGVRRFRDQNGEEVEYQSDAAMAAAIRALDAEIDRLSGRSPRAFTFRTSKGLNP